MRNFYACFEGFGRDGSWRRLLCYGSLEVVNAVIDAAIGPKPILHAPRGWVAATIVRNEPYDIRIHMDVGQHYPFDDEPKPQ